MEISAVIGANYGDEGKGLVTDYLCNKGDEKTLVVRFNGGAQAGHTVVSTKKGTLPAIRHVFHHIGSGTMAGAATFLSRFFIVNPALFMKEYTDLRRVGVLPTMYGDSDALLSTPYDMMLNQAVETKRAEGRHGSCGVGVNETVNRCAFQLFKTTLATVSDIEELKKALGRIRTEYVPQRMDELGLFGDDMPHLENAAIIDRYIQDAAAADGLIEEESLSSLVEHHGFERSVFEGAQGLMLDQDGKDYPHVTRSKTGLNNVHMLLDEAGIREPIKAYYVTRPYLTRHGAGPLPNETDYAPYEKIKDVTNIDNPFQGKLRFGYLDLDDLLERVHEDAGFTYNVGKIVPSPDVYPKLFVTCIDQVDSADALKVFVADQMTEMSMRDLKSYLLNNQFKEVLFSRGPTAGDVFK